MVDVWDTPGGRRWAGPIRTALTRGTCVVVCHPDRTRPSGLIDRIGGWCAGQRPVLQHLVVPPEIVSDDRIGNVELVARDVAEALHLPVEAGTRIRPPDVATHERTDGAVIHIDARAVGHQAASTWCAFAAAIAAGTKDVPASERAAVIVHVVGRLGVEVPDSDTNLRVLWWWGALSSLDLAVLVDEAGRDALDTATITEVARWDVDLAEQLAARWDGNPRSLNEHVVRVADCDNGLIGLDGPAGPVPGEARAAWADGLVDSWVGRRDRHPSLVDTDGMDRRRWHAQVRVVYPWLEELRAEAAVLVAELASRSHLSDAAVEELLTCELGPLRHLACFEHRLPVPAHMRDVLDRAVSARNALAHLSPVDSVTLSSLAAAAAAARCAPGPLK